jgi:hypothetical protein
VSRSTEPEGRGAAGRDDGRLRERKRRPSDHGQASCQPANTHPRRLSATELSARHVCVPRICASYEALIDEMLTISAGVVYVPEEEEDEKAAAEAATGGKSGSSGSGKGKTEGGGGGDADGQSRPSYIRLNDTDDLYRDLRDFNIIAVGVGLTRVGQETTALCVLSLLGCHPPDCLGWAK